MTTQDWTLILLAVAAVIALVVLVTRFKMNAFIALALASLIVGAGGVAMGVKAPGKDESLTMFAIVEIFGAGLGKTLGSIAALIGLGTMFGKLLAESGGAGVLAKRFTAFFGPERVVWCVMALAVVVGLPTWFAVGLVLLQPVLISLTHETKQPFLALAIPLISCMSVMHGLMPPHPGPVAAIGAFDAFKPNMGMVLIWGFLIGLPTAFVAGPIFARRAVRLVPAEAPPMPVMLIVTAARWAAVFSKRLTGSARSMQSFSAAIWPGWPSSNAMSSTFWTTSTPLPSISICFSSFRRMLSVLGRTAGGT